MKPRRNYVDGAFGQIHVRFAASAMSACPPLYCLHQSAKSGAEFESFAVADRRDHAIVAPDYPGNGASDPPLSLMGWWGHGLLDAFPNDATAFVAVLLDRREEDASSGAELNRHE